MLLLMIQARFLTVTMRFWKETLTPRHVITAKRPQPRAGDGVPRAEFFFATHVGYTKSCMASLDLTTWPRMEQSRYSEPFQSMLPVFSATLETVLAGRRDLTARLSVILVAPL
jgi:hypothetical protein